MAEPAPRRPRLRTGPEELLTGCRPPGSVTGAALGGAATDATHPLPPPSQVRAEAGVLETMLALDGRIVALADHLSRLRASCLELYRLDLPDDLADRLASAVAGSTGRHRVRLHWGPELRRPGIEVVPAGARPGLVALHCQPGRTGNWRHKWADRSWLGAQERPDSWPLFTEPGPDGEQWAVETSRSNLAIVGSDSVLRTPPLAENVLPGITRRRLLDAAFNRGRPVELVPVPVCDVLSARLVLSLSSISGIAAVGSLDGSRLEVDRTLLGELTGWLG